MTNAQHRRAFLVASASGFAGLHFGVPGKLSADDRKGRPDQSQSRDGGKAKFIADAGSSATTRSLEKISDHQKGWIEAYLQQFAAIEIWGHEIWGQRLTYGGWPVAA